MNNIELRLQLEKYCKEEYSIKKKCIYEERTTTTKKSLWSFWNGSNPVITYDFINRIL